MISDREVAMWIAGIFIGYGALRRKQTMKIHPHDIGEVPDPSARSEGTVCLTLGIIITALSLIT